MDLFSYNKPTGKNEVPLAEKMRPSSFEQFAGQTHLIGQGKPLRRIIEQDAIGSIIFWGPPGSGKTTLAGLIATLSKRRFVVLSAVNSGVSDLRKVVEASKRRLETAGERTILFIDEIHRFNKTQQDAVLPWVEKGTLTLISATTENPSFGVVPALRSRCRVFRLKPLVLEEITSLLNRALSDQESGLGSLQITMEDKALEHIAICANGDARFALNAIEAAVFSTEPDEKEARYISLKSVVEVIQNASLLYDKMGSEHFDHASAFQKSMRGSDPDAAIYWLAKMIAGGEDPAFITRRMIVTAAEDVGNADPLALLLAISAADAAERLGWPEARIPISQAVCYIASAPKSNASLTAIDDALRDIQKEGKSYPVPDHLKPTSYKDAGRHGFGGYKYPHSHPGNFIAQDYLPPQLAGKRYYQPPTSGREASIKERLEKWGKK